MKDATTSTSAVDAAIAYLAKKGALAKLAVPTPVLYKDIVMWTPCQHDLPPLTVRSI